MRTLMLPMIWNDINCCNGGIICDLKMKLNNLKL